MVYELKKLLGIKGVRWIIFLSFAVAILLPLYFIFDYETVQMIDNKAEVYKGYVGLNARKEYFSKIGGFVTEENIKDEITRYRITNIPDITLDESEYYRIINEAYSSYKDNSLDIKRVNNIPFYSRWKEKIYEKIDFKYKAYDDDEIQQVRVALDNFVVPFYLEFYEHWVIFFKSSFVFCCIVLLGAIFCSSQLFPYEKVTHMDLVLGTLNPKILRKMARDKMLAVSVCFIVLFLICNLIIFSLTILPFYNEGWNMQIQLLPDFFTAIYAWTIKDMFFWYMIVSIGSILSMSFITFFIGNIMKEMYLTILLSLLVVSANFSIDYLPDAFKIVKRYMEISPVNGINLFGIITSMHNFRVLGKTFLSGEIIIAVILLTILFSFLLNLILFPRRLKNN